MKTTFMLTILAIISSSAFCSDAARKLQLPSLATGGSLQLYEGKVFSIYAFGNGPNSLELLVDMTNGSGNAAFLVGTAGTKNVALQSMFELLTAAYEKQTTIEISYVSMKGADSRITGVYSPACHFDSSLKCEKT